LQRGVKDASSQMDLAKPESGHTLQLVSFTKRDKPSASIHDLTASKCELRFVDYA
jgi:hypothetical protein